MQTRIIPEDHELRLPERVNARLARNPWWALCAVTGATKGVLQSRYIESLISSELSSLVILSSCDETSGPVFANARLNSAFILAALSAALVVCFISDKTAQAEPHYRSWDDYDQSMPHYRSSGWDEYEPLKQKRKRRQTNYQSQQKAKSPEVRKGPLQIVVSIADQRLSVYDNGALIATSSVSTGVPGHPTPIGVFSVIGKELWHRSNIYSSAPMPYMQRITWSGIALHAGVVPGHPASHGCIRLPSDFAIRLWHLTKHGTRVIIAPEDVRPIEIANPHLFVSKPKTESGSPKSSTDALAAQDILTLAISPTPLVPNANVLHPSGATPQKKVIPISVFVSRKLSRIFVRQRFTPLFDAPIKIQNPDNPVGTHVFTAMELKNDSASMRWTVLSMPEGSSQSPNAERKILSVYRTPPPNNASSVLDRVEIPDDVIERISELLAPGSSITVSDYGISSETGEDTDFIVVMH